MRPRTEPYQRVRLPIGLEVDPGAGQNKSEIVLRFQIDLAEREGFEPSIRLPVCRISSAVHSTTLPPLQTIELAAQSVFWLTVERAGCYPFATQSFWCACL